jgi:hypothetical protein
MDERERFRQPQNASQPVSNYLDMTSPRRRSQAQEPRVRDHEKESARPVIDNRNLGLEEGNDFA